MSLPPEELLSRKIETLALAHIKYHIFLCCDQSEPKCCQHEDGLKSWKYLKDRINDLRKQGVDFIYRSKVNCLRICMQGPIAVVYPAGIWYHSCTPEVLARIVDEHCLQDKPVEEYILRS